MNKVVKRIINITVDVLIVLILILSILMVTMSLTTQNSGVPNLFGYAPLNVLTDSMEGTFDSGDLIFSKVTNDLSYEYEVDDVVSFHFDYEGTERINTHRIIEVIKDDGITYYKTKGDNNNLPDPDLITSADILAKWTGAKISGFGNVLEFLQSKLGFGLCIVLPMAIFFIYEAVRVVMNIVAYNKEKAIEAAQSAVANAELTEEQKQKAIEEYLASLEDKTDSKKEDDV